MSNKKKDFDFNFDKFLDSVHDYKEMMRRRYLESRSQNETLS
jgi:hypothetical protein